MKRCSSKRKTRAEQRDLRVAYYISSHGFGHAARAAQVIAALPREFTVYVKTLADEAFLSREAGRPIAVTPMAFDFGAWQNSNMAIDWERTFEAAMRIHYESMERLEQEEAFLRNERIDLVVTDIPPPPLVAACKAGIPSLCVANFTWVEVFRRAAKGHREREAFLRDMARCYAQATLVMRPGFAMRMPHFRHSEDCPPIGRRGRNIRSALRAELGLSPRTALILTYLGKWSLGGLRLDKVARVRDVAFVSFDCDVPPLRRLDAAKWRFEDVVASVDAVLAKPGYGTMSECLANGTPVIYYPRPEFSEYFALRRELEKWGGAIRMSTRDFLDGRWENAIRQALALRLSPVACRGAREIAMRIVELAGSH